MNYLEERSIECPYCGEYIGVLIDCSVARQTYVEDCQVCCCPIVFDVHVYGEGDLAIEVRQENG